MLHNELKQKSRAGLLRAEDHERRGRSLALARHPVDGPPCLHQTFAGLQSYALSWLGKECFVHVVQDQMNPIVRIAVRNRVLRLVVDLKDVSGTTFNGLQRFAIPATAKENLGCIIDDHRDMNSVRQLYPFARIMVHGNGRPGRQ